MVDIDFQQRADAQRFLDNSARGWRDSHSADPARSRRSNELDLLVRRQEGRGLVPQIDADAAGAETAALPEDHAGCSVSETNDRAGRKVTDANEHRWLGWHERFPAGGSGA